MPCDYSDIMAMLIGWWHLKNTHSPKPSVANSMILYCFNLQVEVKQLAPQNMILTKIEPHIGAILIAGMWLG